MTPAEFLKRAEKNGWQMQAIKKEVPPGSDRWLLFGFEYRRRSRKYREKFMFVHPVEMSRLAKGPISHEVQPNIAECHPPVSTAADTGARIIGSPSAILGGQPTPLGEHPHTLP